ncbi:MAG TPA: hypothetical protein VKB26_12565 [Candidatus Acidoferrales bacterium]|nr:hypothetical protein [Candidatus Acidoferrales bacterium]
MKRSRGITAAAITLMIVGVGLVCGAFFGFHNGVFLETYRVKDSSDAVVHVLVMFLAFLGVGIWELVTAFGILRLWRWAWFCALVISVLYIGMGSWAVWITPRVLRAIHRSPSFYPAWLIAFQYFAAVWSMIVPLGVGIWWLMLFTRPSVEAQFANHTPSPETPAASDVSAL